MSFDPAAGLRRLRGGIIRGGITRGFVWRVLRAVAIGLVALYVLYLVVGNGVLWARVLPRYLVANEEGIRMDYSSARTFWPGRISAEDVLVASKDSSIELEIRAPRASTTISFVGLLFQRIDLSDSRAEAVTIRVRGRRPEAEALAAQAFLPPMLSWGSVAAEDPVPPPPSNPEDLWHIVIEGAEATVREVWVEGVRITGDLRLTGSFDFRPLVTVVLQDARGTIAGGHIELMGEPEPLAAESADATFRFDIPAFDVPSHELREILRFADVDLDARALVHGGRIANALQDGIEVADGSGSLAMRLALRQGRTKRRSRLLYETVRADVASEVVGGTITNLSVAGLATSDEDVRARLDAVAFDGHLAAAPKSPLHVENATGSIRAKLVPHFMEPAFDGGSVSVPASNLGLAGLDGLVEGLRVRRGIAYVRGSAVLDRAWRGKGEVHTLVTDLDGAVKGVALQGKSRSELDLSEIQLGDETAVRAKGFVTLDDIAMKAGDERVDAWWGRLEIASLLTRKGDAPWNIDADLLGRLRDTRPAVAILDGGGFVPGIVADQLIAEGFVATAAVRKRGTRTQLDLQDGKGDGLRVRGRLVDASKEMRASFLVETTVLDAGISLVRGTTQVQLLAGDGWLAREREFLGGFAAAEASAVPAAPPAPAAAQP